MKLILDVETSGLPLTKGFNNYYHPSDLSKYNKSRLIEIAYVMLEDKTVRIERLIKPEEFKKVQEKE